MSDNIEARAEITIDLNAWIEKAKVDPQTYLERQATEVFLSALSDTHPYNHKVFLKGGVLMGVVYESPRQTGDIDLTTILEPTHALADELSRDLDGAFRRAAARLGYPTLMCRVQSHKFRPNDKAFAKATGPALQLKVAYAYRGSRQEKLYNDGKCPQALEVDISFREPVNAIQILHLGDTGGSINAYSLEDLIAEKLRALMQQESRNRHRRQDIYDIAMLLQRFPFDDGEKAQILQTLRIKCEARGIRPDPSSLNDEVKRRAGKEWETLKLEISDLPEFEDCFARVSQFYHALPWDE